MGLTTTSVRTLIGDRPRSVELERLRPLYEETYVRWKRGEFKGLMHHRKKIIHEVMIAWRRLITMGRIHDADHTDAVSGFVAKMHSRGRASVLQEQARRASSRTSSSLSRAIKDMDLTGGCSGSALPAPMGTLASPRAAFQTRRAPQVPSAGRPPRQPSTFLESESGLSTPASRPESGGSRPGSRHSSRPSSARGTPQELSFELPSLDEPRVLPPMRRPTVQSRFGGRR